MGLKVALQTNPYNRLDLFEAAGIETFVGPATNQEEMIALLGEADGALINTLPLTNREVMEACPKLKVVSRMGVGVDSIDLSAATELGILACNTPGVNSAEVADHAMALLLAMTRRLPEAVPETRDGVWSKDRPRVTEFQTTVRRIAGHTVGIVGFGNIGRNFGARVRGFAPARILAYDPYVEQSTGDLFGVQMVDLDTLAAESDYISIHSSATKANHHLFNAEVFRKMKADSILVNCSRGPLIDQEALVVALGEGQIGGAALDVAEVEPIAPDDPLLTAPNAIVTPHVAGFSPEYLDECPRKQAENVINVLTGKPPHGLANPDVIKTLAVMRSTDPGRWDGIPEFSLALSL